MPFDPKKGSDEGVAPEEFGKKGIPPGMPGKPSPMKSGAMSSPDESQGFKQITEPKGKGLGSKLPSTMNDA